MKDNLNEINHTTLEALGFRNVTPFALTDKLDQFVRDKITVTITREGEITTGVNGSRRSLTFEDIKAALAGMERFEATRKEAVKLMSEEYHLAYDNAATYERLIGKADAEVADWLKNTFRPY